MKLSSVFKAPENAVIVGLAEAGVVFAIYNGSLPNLADVRVADAHNPDVEAARKRAAWMSAALIGIVFFITQDRNAAIIGGAALAGIDTMSKHANAVNPATGRMAGTGGNGATVDNDVAFPMADYADADADAADVPDDSGY